MELSFFIGQLKSNGEIFEKLLVGLDNKLQIWKQEPKKWCLLEIICHLYDEEREDFRQRFRYVLEHPDTDPPSINPVGWVSERRYIDQIFEDKLEAFITERKESIQYLSQLKNIPWENRYNHKHFGPISAKHYLHNWLAHDLLHIKQIIRLKYDYLVAHSTQDMSYAGEWK
jgi:hypothetical protein